MSSAADFDEFAGPPPSYKAVNSNDNEQQSAPAPAPAPAVVRKQFVRPAFSMHFSARDFTQEDLSILASIDGKGMHSKKLSEEEQILNSLEHQWDHDCGNAPDHYATPCSALSYAMGCRKEGESIPPHLSMLKATFRRDVRSVRRRLPDGKSYEQYPFSTLIPHYLIPSYVLLITNGIINSSNGTIISIQRNYWTRMSRPPHLRAVLPCPPPCQNSVERFTRNPRVRDFTRIRVKIGGCEGGGLLAALESGIANTVP